MENDEVQMKKLTIEERRELKEKLAKVYFTPEEWDAYPDLRMVQYRDMVDYDGHETEEEIFPPEEEVLAAANSDVPNNLFLWWLYPVRNRTFFVNPTIACKIIAARGYERIADIAPYLFLDMESENGAVLNCLYDFVMDMPRSYKIDGIRFYFRVKQTVFVPFLMDLLEDSDIHREDLGDETWRRIREAILRFDEVSGISYEHKLTMLEK